MKLYWFVVTAYYGYGRLLVVYVITVSSRIWALWGVGGGTLGSDDGKLA